MWSTDMTQAVSIATTFTTPRPDAIELAFDSALCAGQCAQKVAEGYVGYQARFRAFTKRAPERFMERDWQGSQLDAVDRSDLFDQFVSNTTAAVRAEYGELATQQSFWRNVKRQFANLVAELPDNAFCKAYFNAITRRLHRTLGVASSLEFLITDQCLVTSNGSHAPLLRITRGSSTQLTLVQALKAVPMDAEWQDVDASASQINQYLAERADNDAKALVVNTVELLDTLFYRFTSAYAMGRFMGDDWQLQFALVLSNTETGVVIDRVIVCATELSNLFGEGRADFHAELDNVSDALAYLQTLAPKVRTGKLAATLGLPCGTSFPLALS
jgi:isocitrate dehydrogenase kinase/phosphatase